MIAKKNFQKNARKALKMIDDVGGTLPPIDHSCISHIRKMTYFSLIFGETILGSFAGHTKIGKSLCTGSCGLLRKLPHRRDETILRANRLKNSLFCFKLAAPLFDN